MQSSTTWPGAFMPGWWAGAVRHLMCAHGAGGPAGEGFRHGGWHHRGGGPWGFGPPFGPPWFGGPRRPRPRRGDVRLAILTLLAEQPMHGYQIITELSSRTGGMWQPSPGSVYPTLQQLEDEGLVVVSEQEGRRTFSLTDTGRAEVARSSAGRRAPWEEMSADDDQAASGLRNSAMQLLAAAMQVGATGSDEQIARAETLLNESRRALYRVLAEGDATE